MSEPFDPERFNRRVIEARWTDEQYAVTLECGHTFTCSEGFLMSPVTCIDCVRAALVTERAQRITSAGTR